MHYVLAIVFLLLSTVLTLLAMPGPSQAAPRSSRPNIIVIMSDDQDPGSLWTGNGNCVPAMRNLISYPEGSWINFTDAHVGRALCVPSRAQLLTGQFSFHNGVHNNNDMMELDVNNVLPVWLKEAGYRNGVIGKHYSQWRTTPSHPEWDLWDPGKMTVDENNATAVDFIDDPSEDPFFLFLSHTAPHTWAAPPDRYAKANVCIPPDLPNFNEADVSDKPAHIRKLPLIPRDTMTLWRNERVASQRELLAIDDGIEDIIQTLKDNGKLDNTVIIFYGDNGFSWGSHRRYGKNCELDVCTHVPMFIRYPGVAGNRVYDGPVSSLDITATIVELTGVSPGRTMDGESLTQILESPNGRRDHDAILIENPTNNKMFGIRLADWKYARVGQGREIVLFDLVNDPYELENLAGKPAYSAIEADLSRQLDELMGDNQPPPETETPTPETETPTPETETPTPETVTPTPETETPTPVTETPTLDPCAAVPGNILANPGFESGKVRWSFYSNGKGGFAQTTEDPYQCNTAGQITITREGSNVQLNQSGFTLQPNTTYRLRFAARSTTKRTIQVFLHKNTSPYTNYGLSKVPIPLNPQPGNAWQTFELEFKTRGFTQPVNDTRLRFDFSQVDQPGDVYLFDDIVLIAAADDITVTPTPETETPTPETETPTPETETPTPETETPTPETETPTPETETPTPETETPTPETETPTPETETPTPETETPTPETETPTPETETPTPDPTPPPACEVVPGSLLKNSGFDNGLTSWAFYSGAKGNTAQAETEPGYACGRVVEVAISQKNNNVQLYQFRVPIKANTTYRLTFDARADGTRIMDVYLHQHTGSTANLGLSQRVSLTTDWQPYVYTFEATGSTNNARLRLWFAGAAAGSRFYFDNISLEALP